MHTFMFIWIPCVPHVQQISCVSHVYNDTICTTCLHRYVYHVFSWILYIPHVYMATMCITLGSPFMLNSPFWPHTSFLYSKVCICLSLSLSLSPPTLLCVIRMSAGSDEKSKCLTAIKVSAHIVGYQELHVTSGSSRNQTLRSGDFNVCRTLHTQKVPG